MLFFVFSASIEIRTSLRSLFFVATDEKSLSVKKVLGLDMMLPPSVFKLRILLA